MNALPTEGCTRSGLKYQLLYVFQDMVWGGYPGAVLYALQDEDGIKQWPQLYLPDGTPVNPARAGLEIDPVRRWSLWLNLDGSPEPHPQLELRMTAVAHPSREKANAVMAPGRAGLLRLDWVRYPGRQPYVEHAGLEEDK